MTIVIRAIQFGLVLSAILFALLLLILRVNPEIMLTDYPPANRSPAVFSLRLCISAAMLNRCNPCNLWAYEQAQH